MLRILLAILLFHVAFASVAQISLYKKTADRFVANHFDSSIIKEVKCTAVTIETETTERTEYFYKPNKRLPQKWKAIWFKYSYYSRELRVPLEFHVKVDSSRIISDSSWQLKNIPKCILKNEYCGFISRDSAIRIATNDKIAYKNNLSANLELLDKSSQFIWVVHGSDSNISGPGRRRSDGKNTRFINASTGAIISWDEYHK